MDTKYRLTPKRGRKPENDEDAVELVYIVAQGSDKEAVYAAALQVANDYPESQRAAVYKRLKRKAWAFQKAMNEAKQEEIFAELRQLREENERLRERVAYLEKLLTEKGTRP